MKNFKKIIFGIVTVCLIPFAFAFTSGVTTFGDPPIISNLYVTEFSTAGEEVQVAFVAESEENFMVELFVRYDDQEPEFNCVYFTALEKGEWSCEYVLTNFYPGTWTVKVRLTNMYGYTDEEEEIYVFPPL